MLRKNWMLPAAAVLLCASVLVAGVSGIEPIDSVVAKPVGEGALEEQEQRVLPARSGVNAVVVAPRPANTAPAQAKRAVGNTDGPRAPSVTRPPTLSEATTAVEPASFALNLAPVLRSTGDLRSRDCGPEWMTQSTDPETMEPVVPACAQTEEDVQYTRENYYARCYAVGAYITVNCVDFGVGTCESYVGLDYDVTVTIYEDADGSCPPDVATMQELASMTVTVPDGSSLALVTADFSAIGGVPVAAGTKMVVEVRAPDRWLDTPNPGRFFIGGNNNGESAPGYIRAPTCDVFDYVPFAAIGYPDAHLLQKVWYATTEGVYGACCDPESGDCVDNVEFQDCMAMFEQPEFHDQQSCEGTFPPEEPWPALDPPCGNPGACCDDVADPPVCEDGVLELSCTGTRHEGGVQCADLFPTCGETIPCEHSITMWDSYGDGWNGGSIDVYVGGELVREGLTLLWGHGPETVTFTADAPLEITTVWTPGTPDGYWDHDCSYCIYDVFGNELGCDGLGSYEVPTGITVTAFCGGPGACCDPYTGECEDGVEYADCLASGRVPYFGEQCAALDPPCGNPGCCCDEADVACDLDGDGEADWDDYNIIRDAFGYCEGQPRYVAEADFDRDGCITWSDHEVFWACFEDPESYSIPSEEFQINCRTGRFLPGVVGAECTAEAFEPPCGLLQPAGVLYAPSSADNPEFRALLAEILMSPVDYFDARGETPTLEELMPYAAVLTWANDAYADNVAMGNVLADYVDAGGKVILGQWTYHSSQYLWQGNWLEGRIMEPEYCPVTVSTSNSNFVNDVYSYSGDGILCVHTAESGAAPVSNYQTQYQDVATLREGPFWSDGTFDDGSLAVAFRADCAVYYSPGNTGYTYSRGDWAALTANMVLCDPPELIGACCDPYDGTCADDFLLEDCATVFPGAQFFHQEQCADLEPACGNPGCCCDTFSSDVPYQEFERNCPGRFLPEVLGENCLAEAFDPVCGTPLPLIDFDPGMGPPPADLFGCREMTPFPDDPRPIHAKVTTVPSPCVAGGEIQFSIPLMHRRVGEAGLRWSHGYVGDVYRTDYIDMVHELTLTLPPGTCAFYFYVEPRISRECSFRVIVDGWYESEEFLAAGPGGAAYCGVYYPGMQTLQVQMTCSWPCALQIGEFGICCYDCADVYGACCDLETGNCVDNVAPLECLSMFAAPQFHYQQSCEGTFPPEEPWPALDPPCGNPGACCDGMANPPLCEDGVLELNCAGIRHEGGVLCADLVPPCDETIPCEHSITMWDSYGDGWTGGHLDVYVGGELVLEGVTLESGFGPETVTFAAAWPQEITTVYTSGYNYLEPSYCIYDVLGNELGCDGLCLETPTGITVTAFCGGPWACCDPYTGECEDGVEYADCLASGRVPHFGEQCAALDPPCGNPGACCDDMADPPVCENGVLELNCAGTRHEGGVLCDELDPPCGEAPSCEHSVILWDSSGDGWNGGYIDVYVGGELVLEGVTLESGFGPETVTFGAYAPLEITTVWTPGVWPEEVSYCISHVFGGFLGCDGVGAAPTGITVAGFCGGPGACCDPYTGECEDGVEYADCLQSGRVPHFGEQCAELQPACGEETRVLYAPTRKDNVPFRWALTELLGGPVDYFDAGAGTPTLDQLLAYDCVLTWVFGHHYECPYADSVAMGNVLADYVDAGGKVILGQWTYWSGQSNSLDGRIMEPDYCPVTVHSYSSPGCYSGDGVLCPHIGPFPVAEYATEYYMDRTQLNPASPAAVSDGTFDISDALAVAWRADCAVYYSPGNTGTDLGTGDWVQLTANMCACPCGPHYGACCNLWTGDCTDDVEATDCISEGFQFHYQRSCAELEPACGDPGCCCVDMPDGETFHTFRAICEEAGGRFLSGVAPEDCFPEAFYPPCGTACRHSITMWDDWGDGWDGGASLDVYVNGVRVLDDVTLVKGYGPETVYFWAGTVDEITTVWTPGVGDPWEPSYCIYGADGMELGCDGLDGAEPVGISVWGYCGPTDCGDGDCEFPLETCVNCPEDCGECECIAQPPNQSNGMVSDLDCDFCGGNPIQILAENFYMWETAGVLSVKFWGGYYPGNHGDFADQFTVIIWEDAGGLPGAEIAAFGPLAPTSKVDTGVDLFYILDEWEYIIALDCTELVGDTTYFIEIYNNTAGDTDSWLWEYGDLDSLEGIPGSACSFTLPEEPWVYEVNRNLAYELECGPCRE